VDSPFGSICGHVQEEVSRSVALTYDRAEVAKYWAGDGFEAPGESWVLYWLNLTDSGGDFDPSAILSDLVLELNSRALDWSEESDEGSQGELSIDLRGNELIGLHCPLWAQAPLEYLDAFCAALTNRGWQGHLTRHEEPPRIWVPYGPEPTITTMLGYGVVPDPNEPHRGADLWQVQTELIPSIVEIALDWIDAAGPAPITYWSGISWQPTRVQARELLQRRLRRRGGVELGRVASERQQDLEHRRVQRTGRTAVFDQGHLMLTENDRGRSLQERLADHHEVLLRGAKDARYGLTRGTIGHAPPGTVYGFKGEWVAGWGPPLLLPPQRSGHSPGLPDAYYAQLFETSLLDGTTLDPAAWVRKDLSTGLTIITARDDESWFALQPAADARGPNSVVHGPTQVTLAAARTSLSGTLQRPLPTAE
ncbi:hypothetical protein Q9S36_51040, partial [Microbacterium sp. ARD31]|uniref:hypothetical protein n=1 Tax=Microbacterium sp. ARD31 TaxID=2962576 RepID=UPI002880F049